MNAIASWALGCLAAYGVPILIGVAYAGSLGIPFPITVVIIAAGAFARMGILDWRLAMLACMTGAALADNSEYLLGRHARSWLKEHFGHTLAWEQANAIINRQGGWSILLTRFWLTSLAPAVNVISGSRYPYGRFLLFDLAGQFLWVLIYGGAGYLFADRWNQVSQVISGFTGVSAGLVVAAWVIYNLVRRFRKARLPYTKNKPLHNTGRVRF